MWCALGLHTWWHMLPDAIHPSDGKHMIVYFLYSNVWPMCKQSINILILSMQLIRYMTVNLLTIEAYQADVML